jgi:hypothetical protein
MAIVDAAMGMATAESMAIVAAMGMGAVMGDTIGAMRPMVGVAMEADIAAAMPGVDAADTVAEASMEAVVTVADTGNFAD